MITGKKGNLAKMELLVRKENQEKRARLDLPKGWAPRVKRETKGSVVHLGKEGRKVSKEILVLLVSLERWGFQD